MNTPMKKSEPSKNSTPHWIRVLGGIGNVNILYSHIQELKKRVLDIRQGDDVKSDPDYYCWLLLNSVLIAQVLEHKYLRHNPNVLPEQKNEYTYEKMIQFVKKQLSKENQSDLQYLHSVIELRNRLMHLGTPNLIVEPEAKEFLNLVLDKGDYKKASDYFHKAQKLIENIPDPIIPIGRFGQIGR